MSSGKMRSAIPLGVASLLFASTAVADVKETEEFTFDINPGGRISLENINGDISITGTEGDTVNILAHKKADVAIDILDPDSTHLALLISVYSCQSSLAYSRSRTVR